MPAGAVGHTGCVSRHALGPVLGVLADAARAGPIAGGLTSAGSTSAPGRVALRARGGGQRDDEQREESKANPTHPNCLIGKFSAGFETSTEPLAPRYSPAAWIRA